MKTVVDKEYVSEVFQSSKNLLDTTLKIEVYGQTVDRSFEDRTVYLEVEFQDKAFATWIDGEEAIDLGMMLIKHGKNALEANMINHQRMHLHNSLRRYIDEGRVKKLIFTMIDDKPKNHGGGWKTFRIVPIWVKGKAAKYDEDFYVDDVLYISPIEKEYKQFLSSYKVPIMFVGYDHKLVMNEFKSKLRMS